jgi:single-strand DNA-binding protein
LTDFFNCVAWRGTAENIAKFFKKGNPIGLIGSMNSRVYENRNGEKQMVWELNVKNFYFVGGAKEENQNTQGEKPTRKAPTQLDDAEDTDFPF